MKKKILLVTLMVALFVCLFVLGTSAVTPNNDGETYTTSDGVTLALYDTEGNALAWFKDPTTSEYVAYRPVIDFTATLSSGREIHTNNKTLNDTDGDSSTTFPYSLDNLVVFNARDYDAFTYISGTWKTLPLEAIYVNNNFQWINKQAFNDNSTLRVFDIPKDHNASKLHIGAAFVKANALESFYVPKNAAFEGTSTFEYSTALKYVEFHDEWAYTLKGFEFNGCTALETVKLASTATSIPEKTFYNCKSLKSIDIPSGVTSIGKQAFAFDSNVSNNTINLTLTFPSGLTTVGDNFLQNNNSLVAVNFTGTSLQSINSPAFENCKRLTSIVLPEGLTTLGNCAFKNCSGLTSVTFPSTLTTLNGSQNFLGTALTEVIGLENTKITSIPYQCFKGLSNWKPETLIIPNTVTSIGSNGIADIGMKNLVLGAGLTSMAGDALAGCKSLQTIYVPAGLDTLSLNTSTAKLIFVTSTDKTVLEGFKADTGATSIITKDEYDANPSNYASGKYIISGLEICDTFYNGIHELDPDKSNACAGECKNCKKISLSENPVHVEKVVITFTDLAKTGTKVTTCENENCPHNVTEILPAVFTYAGISADMATHQFVTVGYLINQDSLKAYMSTLENGVAFSYGFVATATKAETAINGAPISAETGLVTASNMVQINLSAQEDIEKCSAFDFKMAGNFTVEKYLNANLGIALYTMTRTTSAGVDTYTVKYVTADTENAKESVSVDTLTSFTFAEKIAQGE